MPTIISQNSDIRKRFGALSSHTTSTASATHHARRFLLLLHPSERMVGTYEFLSTSLSAVSALAEKEETSTLVSASPLFFLIGFMGSGKSLLSRGVSSLLDVITVEMDELIEKSAGMTINDIFARQGEETFRKIEREVLQDIIGKYRSYHQPVLVSTGGGAPCHFDNIQVMNQSGTTIFINPSAQRLSERLEQKKKDRPLIKDKTIQEIRAYVKSKLTERMPFYKQAMLEVNMIYDDKAANIEFLKDIVEAKLSNL